MRKLKAVIVKHENRIRQLEEIGKAFENERTRIASNADDDPNVDDIGDDKPSVNNKPVVPVSDENPDLAPDEV